MNKAYIALGSNIEPRSQHLMEAIQQLETKAEIDVGRQSSIYETEPVGYTQQNRFLNMVIEIQTNLTPQQLLDICQEVERRQGRRREIKWGPRTLDLDILLYNQENIETDRLILPHPHMQKRAFVLIPLQEIYGQLYLSHVESDVSTLIEKLPAEEKEGVVKWKETNGGEE
ncbi:2-amino-4-hydroxy-6-hydroxymethyldihydropteridine diphosphokinase [Gracilibacillus sp. YIM 98692]|uniref:2-amino-4-hydroxy-6- hydroxymethyldihydropteridine diphosphokinase n=1 Tax=Gracilibacillus sp. YIM 98692 TaxID=2663532 RepID=UPI0013D239D3|nr:2-amino-4-hydroxy-6-hydroxymethyldihydropteridine diphosphokinase [Gracilibacillus sp. YIM 98692]